MTEQDRIIAGLRAADITKDDWWYGILESITNRRAKGYLDAEVEHLSEGLYSDSEDFRAELIERAGYDLWNWP